MIKQQDLMMVQDADDMGLSAAGDIGSGKARNKEEAWLSQIITRLNDMFITDGFTDNDLINWAYSIRDKISENETVVFRLQITQQNRLCWEISPVLWTTR